MSSLAYTRDPSSAHFYDVALKDLSRKELREIIDWYYDIDPINLIGGLPIEKLAIHHLNKGRRIVYDFRNKNGKLMERLVGTIYKRRGAKLTVFHNLNGLHIITLRHEHPFWEDYLAKKANRHFRMLKRKMQNKNLKNFTQKVEEMICNWTKHGTKFKESYFDEKVHNYSIACNISVNYIPLSHKLVKLLKISNKLRFSN